MAKKSYYLGLDIGTNSVGYAVTDEEYNLLKFRGEPAWGVTVFDEGELCEKRRKFRSARRRLDRQQQRVDLLQELFAKEIAKVDPRFLSGFRKARCIEKTRKTNFFFLMMRLILIWIFIANIQRSII